MTILTAPVGYGVAYTPANVTAVPMTGRKVNPYKDPIFIDPTTGERTTWQPGIYDPDKKEKKGKGVIITLATAAAAALLLYAFRGKIANSALWKNTLKPALDTAKTWLSGKYTLLKNSKLGTKIVNGFNAVKNSKFVTKVTDMVKDAYKTVVNVFNKAPKV